MELTNSIVAIMFKESGDQAIAGTGFVADRNIVITCAHVMNRIHEQAEGIFLKFGSLGILGITIPEEYGGTGLAEPGSNHRRVG